MKDRNQKNITLEEGMSCEQKYLRRLAAFERFYIGLLALVGITVAASIAIAVMSNVLLGMSLALLGAALYVYFVSDELYKQLGLRYKNECGSITVTRATASYGDTLVLPARLLYADVTRIADGALNTPKNSELTRIYIPKSIKYIGSNVLPEVHCLTDILFEGTREQWDAIEKHSELDGIKLSLECEYPLLPPRQKKPKKKNVSSPDGNDNDGGATE